MIGQGLGVTEHRTIAHGLGQFLSIVPVRIYIYSKVANALTPSTTINARRASVVIDERRPLTKMSQRTVRLEFKTYYDFDR